LDLRQLEIIRAIAETGSFTAAGHKLHVSQSAISRQILLLEDELKEPCSCASGAASASRRPASRCCS
jgi:molybdenum-dependent DNA-binding transcriptional regulator ModE